MFKLKLAVVAAAASLVALTAGSAAYAAYEDPVVTIDLNTIDVGSGDGVVLGGTDVAGTVTSTVPCDWRATFNGNARNGNGLSFSFSFDTPKVTKKTTFPLTVSCTYDDGNTGPASAAISDPSAVTNALYVPGTAAVVPAALQTVTRTVDVVVVATLDGADSSDNASDSGALPNTGGPNVLLIGAGAALLVVGAGAVFVARRKSDQAA